MWSASTRRPWNDGWSFEAARERLEAYLEARQFRGAIAFSEQAVVGLLVGQKERWVQGFHFFLQEMCVTPNQQRRGVGRALLGHIRAVLRSEGVEKIYLATGPKTPAASFYAANGFYPSRGRQLMTSVVGQSD